MTDYIKKIIIHSLILFFLTIPFWLLNIDIAFSRLFYNENAGWYLFNNKIVNIFYRYGTYPAIIFSVFCIIILTFQKFFNNKQDLKKIAIVFLITLILAPGIIINVLLKNYSGRPRPREIVEFNGKWEYRKVLQIGQPGRGYSFPCGHSSMGFIFCSVYFILRNKRKIIANTFLWAGLIYGFIIGFVRIAQGGHFLSDVIWAGGITIITSELAYYLLFETKKNYVADFLINKKIPIFSAVILSIILILLLLLFFLMSVPFYREHKIDLNVNNDSRFVFNGEGNLKINNIISDPYIFITASGFGLPRSNFLWNYNVNDKNGFSDIIFNTYKKGFFQELSADININLLKDKKNEIIINNTKGNIECDLPYYTENCIFFTRAGDIFLNINGHVKELFIKNLKGDVYLNLNKNAVITNDSFFVINASSGIVKIKNSSNYFRELNNSAKDIMNSKELFMRSKKTGHTYLNINAKKIIIN